MSAGGFVARFGPDAGRGESSVTPGLELQWSGSPAEGLPGSARVVCIIDGWVEELAPLATELGVEGDDARVFASGYERFGEAVLERVHGSFSVLLWDRDRRRGIAARDQLGGRPLFYCSDGNDLVVASEVRDLVDSVRSVEPDPVGLAHWLARRPLPDSRTLYDGVSRLPAGRLLRVGAEGGAVRRWWAPSYREPPAVERADAVRELREAMRDAVARALARAERPGLMLSGGLDSACVAGMAHDLGSHPRTYAGVFPAHPRVDESARIRAVSDALGLDAHELSFAGGSALAAAARYSDVWALPPSSPNWFVWEPLYEVARADGVDVMLDGEGGDELFGCSPRLLADLLRAGRAREMIAQARRIPGMGPNPKAVWLRRAVKEYAVRGLLPPRLHATVRRLRNPGGGPGWLTPAARGLLERDSDRDAWKKLEGPRWWASLAFSLVDGPDRMASQDEGGRSGGPGGFLVAHPWRDLPLVQLTLSLPPQLAFDSELDRPLAREAVRGLIPDTVRLSVDKPFFNDLLDDALAGPDSRQLQRLASNPPEAISWAVRPRPVRPSTDNRSDTLVAWRIATAGVWAESLFGDRSVG